MKTLIGVTTCHKRKDRCDSQRATWAKDSVVDTIFFCGAGPVFDNSVILDCPDGYHKEFTTKVQAVCRWALEHDYDRLWKVDDDVYLRPERLIGITADYFGFVCNMIDGVPTNRSFCMGPIYSLSKKSMEVIVNAGNLGDKEDEWVGETLLNAGIIPVHTDLIRQEQAHRRRPIEDWVPTLTNDIISSAEWENSMWTPHNVWLDSLGEEKLHELFV